VEGKYADLAVLSDDYLSVPEQRIRKIESVLTLLGGKVVHASGPFSRLLPR
jgi:predicted amidohydrolase YtcJ